MKLPSRGGAFDGIDGLPLIIVSSNALVFLFDLLHPGLIGQLVLSHAALAAGQWWRLATFVFVPPFVDRFFFWQVTPLAGVVVMVFWFLFLYAMAASLERAWGGFRFTVYFLVGWAATALVGFLPWPGIVGNGFLQASLFLAFATLFPEEEVLLFFLLPVRVRWLGLLTWASLGAGILFGDGLTRATIAAGLVNYFLVLGPDLRDRARLRWQVFLNRRRFRGGP